VNILLNKYLHKTYLLIKLFFKKRAAQAKNNRAHLPYNHTGGSQSFSAKLSLQVIIKICTQI
jgi:hypothetical protein